MEISKEIILAALPKGTKKITAKALSSIGLIHRGGGDYDVEDRVLFQENVWVLLDSTSSLDLLLDAQLKHSEELDELKYRVTSLENMQANIRALWSRYVSGDD